MTGADTIRVLVVDDSHFVRTVVSDVLEDAGLAVVGTANDGQEAVEKVVDLRPDVVTMDVEMPEMGGLEAVEEIMDKEPTPILMLSAHTEEGAEVTFDALEAGAVDVYPKPGGEVSVELSSHADALVEKVQEVAQADVGKTVTRERAVAGGASTAEPAVTPTTPAAQYVDNPTLLIGSSTGGPKVVEQILAELPREANFRILLVQHMPEEFTGRFAERLDKASDYDIKEAEDGDRISGGEGLVANGSHHLTVSGYGGGRIRVKLTDEAPVMGNRPAVDVTMRTAADAIDDPMVGVILTGMGADGAEGIKAIKGAGAYTIAQDESTSAVHSMPRNAIDTGCVDDVRPLDEIPGEIITAITEEEK